MDKLIAVIAAILDGLRPYIPTLIGYFMGVSEGVSKGNMESLDEQVKAARIRKEVENEAAASGVPTVVRLRKWVR